MKTIDPENPPQGIFPGIPEAVYRKSKGICQSNLKLVKYSPRHYLTATLKDGEEKESTPDQLVGTVTHSVLLENKWNCVVRPEGMNFSTKEGKAWRDAQALPIIYSKDRDHIMGMANSVKNHPLAARLLYGKGDNEVACWKLDEATGLLLKGRADRLTMDDNNRMVLPDIKTCGDSGACLADFTYSILSWEYYRQAAFYIDLFGASTFIIVAVEKEPPHGVACYELDAEDIALGRRENQRDLAILRPCVESGIWPCYPEVISRISLPEHVRRKKLEAL